MSFGFLAVEFSGCVSFALALGATLTRTVRNVPPVEELHAQAT